MEQITLTLEELEVVHGFNAARRGVPFLDNPNDSERFQPLWLAWNNGWNSFKYPTGLPEAIKKFLRSQGIEEGVISWACGEFKNHESLTYPLTEKLNALTL